MTCLLLDKKVIIKEQYPDEAPNIVTGTNGYIMLRVGQPLYGALLNERDKQPCDICPHAFKQVCEAQR